MAETVRFGRTVRVGRTPAFKAGAIDRTLPRLHKMVPTEGVAPSNGIHTATGFEPVVSPLPPHGQSWCR
jgi:hypothetical protein